MKQSLGSRLGVSRYSGLYVFVLFAIVYTIWLLERSRP